MWETVQICAVLVLALLAVIMSDSASTREAMSNFLQAAFIPALADGAVPDDLTTPVAP